MTQPMSERCDDLLLGAVLDAYNSAANPLIVGLSGPQGSGKSTATAKIAKRIDSLGLRTVVCCLDDFYLTRAERQGKAAEIHPLLAVRGVPGTHDIALLAQMLHALLNARPTDVNTLPAFDKVSDDRMPGKASAFFTGRPDIILLEGWCIGARPQPAESLTAPINVLESSADPDGKWRKYVNGRLASDYADLFKCIDLMLQLRAPHFACVQSWRAEQEARLPRGSGAPAPMTGTELSLFIAHYERITRWMMLDEPADLVVDLDERRKPISVKRKPRTASSFKIQSEQARD